MSAIPNPLDKCNFVRRRETIEITFTINVSVESHHQNNLARHGAGNDVDRPSDANLADELR